MNDGQHGHCDELVSVFTAPDEVTANIVASLLEGEGVSAMVQPRGSTWSGREALAGAAPADGAWGDVMVFERDAPKSLQMVHAYRPEGMSGEEAVAAKWSANFAPSGLRMPSIVCLAYTIVCGWATWSRNEDAEIPFLFVATLSFVAWGVLMLSYERFVPQPYRRANRQVGRRTLIAGLLFAIPLAARLELPAMPLAAALSIYALILAGSVYDLMRPITGDEEERDGSDA